jgi:hypothetical protein
MKHTFTIITVIILIIVGSVLFLKSANAPTDQEIRTDGVSVNDTEINVGRDTSSTPAELGSSTSTGEVTEPQEITSAIEKQQQIRFQCDGRKEISAIRYIGGKQPRIDVTLTDFGDQEKGVENESRTFTLNQIPATSGILFTNADKTITLKGTQDTAQLIENGVSVFKNCTYVTSTNL